ncbi:jg23155 [Pararge aegeria aegeria]|uniref:Jg23155 protein n=1 Tax=Pararge aegeria aegeria TaxID=348720 RepID=A0A8S4QK23_9NEOP|nr:jg23155 [Pararge aegeria aegeria]
MDVGVPRCWNGSPELVSAALVGPQRGGQTTLSASQVAAGSKRLRTVELGIPYKRPICPAVDDDDDEALTSVQRAGGCPTLRLPIRGLHSRTSSSPTTDMTRPLPLQLAYPLSYVGDLGSSTDFVVANSIPKRDSQHSSLHSALRNFKFVDQVDCQCPRLRSLCHFRQDTLVEVYHRRIEESTQFTKVAPSDSFDVVRPPRWGRSTVRVFRSSTLEPQLLRFSELCYAYFCLKGVVTGVITGTCGLTPTPQIYGHTAACRRTCSSHEL